jgi:hypothetical protein
VVGEGRQGNTDSLLWLGRSLALPRGHFAGTTEHQLGDAE